MKAGIRYASDYPQLIERIENIDTITQLLHILKKEDSPLIIELKDIDHNDKKDILYKDCDFIITVYNGYIE